jgi:hypothetical protein
LIEINFSLGFHNYPEDLYDYSMEARVEAGQKYDEFAHRANSFLQVSITSIFYLHLFHTKVLCAAFLYLQFGFVTFWQKDIGAKAAHNTVCFLKFIFLAALASWLCRLHRFGLFLTDKLSKKFGQQFFSGPRYAVNPYCLL